MKNKAEQKRKRKRCSTNFYFGSYFEKNCENYCYTNYSNNK